MMSESRRGWSKRAKFALFALTPVTILIVAAELIVRICGLDQPQMKSEFLTPGFYAVHRHDSDLFFALRSNLRTTWDGVEIRTNSASNRSGEIGAKARTEFRILSLGESTTFGAAVAGDETYSAVLERRLRQLESPRKFSVINAGVSAYTSFQSLKYLELHGLSLKPDLILFYHEINDFLPTTIREGESPTEAGLALTDRQLSESKNSVAFRKLADWSAIARMVMFSQARSKLEALPPESTKSMIPKSFQMVKSRQEHRLQRLPTRVSLEERKDNFQRLHSLCKENDIQLVIIHPSYRLSKRHECELTQFCQAENVPMFEAHDILHPQGGDPTSLFRDFWHPNVAGHRLLADGILEFLVQHRLIPTSS